MTRSTTYEGLLDTSFFVATESGRPIGGMEGITDTEVPVATLAELTVVVLTADDDHRPARVATLSAVESTRDPLPIDAEVARQIARIVAAPRAGGRRVPFLDALVAATAIVQQIPAVTQDNRSEAVPSR